jgi:hypothetical protein
MANYIRLVYGRLCNAMNTILYASQIFSLLQAQEEEDSSTDLLCRRLVENETNALQLGWIAADYYTKDELGKLTDAMKSNTSVTSVSIGWSLRQRSLLIILEAVACMENVQHLSLVLHTELPDWAFDHLKDCVSLRILDVRNVRVHTCHPFVFGPHCFASREMFYQDHNIVHVLPQLDGISSLKLIDCDIQYEQVQVICKHATERIKPLRELSLAHNTTISSSGIQCLLRANIQRLDLTGCEIPPPGARAIASTLLSLDLSSPLRKLCLSRNIYLGAGLIPLLDASCQWLVHLDLGFCKIPTDVVFESIPPRCTLRELSMQGYEEYPGLQNFLIRNQSLRSLIVNNPEDRTRVAYDTYKQLNRGLAQNYFLENVQVDWGDSGHVKIDFFLKLNKAGRKILLGRGGDWAQVLASASSDAESLYWLLCNGVLLFQLRQLY